MLDETHLLSLLEKTRKDARTLTDKPKLTEAENLQLIRLNERIDTLKLVVGEDRKKELFKTLKDLKITDTELLKASIYVLEQLLIARGFTSKEEVQINLLNVIRSFRAKHAGTT